MSQQEDNASREKDSIPNETSEANPAEPAKTSKAPGVLSIFQSVIAAMFGVQSDEKRKQDFEHGSIGNYIFVGVVMVMIFILTLVAIVDSILENAGQ